MTFTGLPFSDLKGSGVVMDRVMSIQNYLVCLLT